MIKPRGLRNLAFLAVPMILLGGPSGPAAEKGQPGDIKRTLAELETLALPQPAVASSPLSIR